MQKDWLKVEKVLKSGGIAVIPTDTLYGLVASAFDKKAIEKIYKIKERDKSKALIVLISSFKDLEKFGIKVIKEQAKILEKFWPGQVSVLLSCKSNKFKYIHSGTGEIAFRMIGPRNKNLYNLLRKVGPIVAPSANRENGKPAETIKEAKEYFDDKVDYYINSGKKVGEPSTLVRVKEGKIEVLRQGRVFLI
ncbi:MAG: Sua5/YciO/YrdC/YwlC family protein [Candidatus Nomurabacteria bacterium GW2011_GWF2_35_66]|uniref:L-threonylcarbamoyladenylate synthase n=1 Tax=Candidatus Nomurabacteria bacterium GW2011_GWE1_35_16 TaxID=1618761 RepID=A0A0G0B8E3_9BACT|nr:MAG: Sua5/YciO/YrdC/YwlC family protein [Candidatus Nomurabacteria bacterium GW2011_GWF1_34_20]KKP63183.1 MAG: Sua5/YciO/YrdC/YwlC family protein [Candidatus Nomurabacteria bacterium GW2011_GWE2_34_25]KKP65643.1 MAG: Sua5/YciO/YrdC/YwlC family protein [Candidatus Nomurabacteria bacterium GW2011_GWE1_35_16]KKP83269.1 MAG: Sua5/YciO/YrdC/YwlC family protein [Candidatus Nomurabacteria bacterium GW2011_GWF2_35_66]HAE36715.1 threonylcarbamoyl-AMP synthase [Candidatus Nomurabacteria bacterium]